MLFEKIDCLFQRLLSLFLNRLVTTSNKAVLSAWMVDKHDIFALESLFEVSSKLRIEQVVHLSTKKDRWNGIEIDIIWLQKRWMGKCLSCEHLILT